MAYLVIDYRKEIQCDDNNTHDFLVGFCKGDYNYLRTEINFKSQVPSNNFPDEVIVILPESNIHSVLLSKVAKWVFDSVTCTIHRMR